MIFDEILMPINTDYIEVFSIFMDDKLQNKIRAQNVRQYIEGIIDLFLKDKIIPLLKENENFDGLSQKKILSYVDEYDCEISTKIRRVFEIGGKASHFKNKIDENELNEIVNLAIHIVEDIFVQYFSEPEHIFGKENIFTIFSMLPLKNRIYILDKLYNNIPNRDIVDRLSLAYYKNGEITKAQDLLNDAKNKGIVDVGFVNRMLTEFEYLGIGLDSVLQKNANYDKSDEIYGKIIDNVMVVGLPSSKNVFETQRALLHFESWIKEGKEEYPEFMNLFLYLMQTDDRKYE